MSDSTKGRLLLADDEIPVLITTRAILEQEGYEVLTARDADEAMKALENGGFDLIIVDYKMSGNEQLEFVRFLCVERRECPVMVFTGYPSLASALESLRLEVFDYVTKPLDIEDFKRRVAEGVQRHRLQRAVSKSEERSGVAIQGGQVAVWDWRVGEPNVYVSPVLERMLGFREGEIPRTARAWLRRSHPDDRSQVLRSAFGHLRDRTPYFEIEHRMIDRSGETRWFLSRANVSSDPRGGPGRLLGATTDITRAKHAEQALCRRECYLACLNKVTRDLLAGPRPEKSIPLALKRLRAVAQADRCFLLETHAGPEGRIRARQRFEDCARDVPPLGDAPRFQDFALEDAGLGRLLEAVGQGRTITIDVSSPEPAERAFLEARGARSLLLCPIPSRGTHRSVLGLEAISEPREWTRNETSLLQTAGAAIQTAFDRREAEEGLRRSARLEATATLAGGVAHDFNNLMVPVLGAAEILKDDLAGNLDAVGLLDDIAQSARRAGELSQQLLAYARGGDIEPERLNLTALVRRALMMRQCSVEDDNLRMVQRLEPALWPVLADPTQMTQVLVHLCRNAIEAVEGRPDARIVVTSENLYIDGETFAREPGVEPGRHVRLSVSDTGVGMDEATRLRAFEPFFTTKFQGRGLGLAAVHGIVERHGGRVFIESHPGGGTTVHVVLPAAEGEPEDEAENPCETPGDVEAVILVVDDDTSVREATRRMLDRLGYHALLAADGREAVELVRARQGRLDLVLLDLDMPLLDGARAFPLLRAARPGLRVLVCSGFDHDETADRLLQAGAVGFLQKPYRLEELRVAVQKALGA